MVAAKIRKSSGSWMQRSKKFTFELADKRLEAADRIAVRSDYFAFRVLGGQETDRQNGDTL